MKRFTPASTEPRRLIDVGCHRLLLSRTVHMSNLSDFIYLFATHYKTPICRKMPERQGFIFASYLSFGGQFVGCLRWTRMFLAYQSEIIPIDHLPKLSHNDPTCTKEKRGKASFRNNKTKHARLECDWIQSDLAVSLAFHCPPNCLSTTLDLGDNLAFQKYLKEARRGLPLRSNIYQVNENEARCLYLALKVARFRCCHGRLYTKTNWLPAGVRWSV